MNEPPLEPILRKLRTEKIKKFIPKSSTVVDVGCGREAYFLNSISSSIKEGIGIDQSTENKKTGNLTFMRLPIARKIPLPDKTADCITMMAVLEHLDHPREILEESLRILKEGGILLMTSPTPVSKPILNLFALRLNLLSKRQIDEHKSYFWGSELRKLLLEIGFRKVENKYFELFFNNLIIARK